MNIKQQHTLSRYTDQRLKHAQAQLNSTIADAASQGILDEANAGRLLDLVSVVPHYHLHREIVTEQAERLAQGMSYLNELHVTGKVETEWARLVISMNQPELISSSLEFARRDFSLIEQRLDEAVTAGVIDAGRKAKILANPYLNLQAADALDVISPVPRSSRRDDPPCD